MILAGVVPMTNRKELFYPVKDSTTAANKSFHHAEHTSSAVDRFPGPRRYMLKHSTDATLPGRESLLRQLDIWNMTDWFARPALHVTAVDASLRFHVNRLGFTSPWRSPER